MTERAFDTNRTPPWAWPLDFRRIIILKKNPRPLLRWEETPPVRSSTPRKIALAKGASRVVFADFIASQG